MIVSDYENVYLDAATACFEDNDIYFFGKTINLLYIYHIKENATEILSSIPGIPFYSCDLIGKIVKYKDRLILIPYCEKNIWIYDITYKKWEKIPMRISNDSDIVALSACKDGNKLFVFGTYQPYIVKMDMDTNLIEYNDEICERLSQYNNNNADIYFRSEYIKSGSIVSIGYCRSNKLLELDLSNMSHKIIDAPEDIQGVEGISCNHDRNIFVLGDRNPSRIIYSKEGNWHTIIIPQDCDYYYLASFIREDGILLLGKEVGSRSLLLKWDGELTEIHRSFYFCEKDNNVSCVMDTDNNLFLLDEFGYKKENVRCILDKDTFWEYAITNGKIDVYYETRDFKLYDFLSKAIS